MCRKPQVEPLLDGHVTCDAAFALQVCQPCLGDRATHSADGVCFDSGLPGFGEVLTQKMSMTYSHISSPAGLNGVWCSGRTEFGAGLMISFWTGSSRKRGGEPNLRQRGCYSRRISIDFDRNLSCRGIDAMKRFSTVELQRPQLMSGILKFAIGGFLGGAYRSTPRRRSALAITDTEERLIAAAAIIGDSNSPVIG